MTRPLTVPLGAASVAVTSTFRAFIRPPSSETCVTVAVAVALPLYARVEVIADVVEVAPRCDRESVPLARTNPQIVVPSSRANAVACAVAGCERGVRATAVATTASASTSATKALGFTRHRVVS